MNTIGNYFRTLGILHAALCSGAGVCILMLRFMGKDHTPGDDAQIFLIVGGAIAVANVIMSRVLLFKIVSPAQQQSDLGTKLALFRSGFVVQMALLESVVIINIILWFIAANTYNLGIALVALFLMIYRRPARTFVRDMIFNPNEDGKIIFNDDVEY